MTKDDEGKELAYRRFENWLSDFKKWSTMGRFLDRYNKHPENGTDRYIQQAIDRKCSISLGRNFGEPTEEYLARSESAAEGMRECNEDIAALKKIAGGNA